MTQAATRPSDMPPVRVGSFTVVSIGVPLRAARGAAGWASVALHEEAGQRTLIDCGGRGDAWVVRRSLEGLGVSPGQIDVIVLTHLHFDHAGALSLYPSAKIIVSADEMEHARRAQTDPWLDSALTPGIVDELATRTVRVVRGGDRVGGLTVVALPGHTPGSIGFVDHAGVLFAGDAVKNVVEMSGGAPRAAFDMDQATDSIARIKGASFQAVIPGHDRPFTATAKAVSPLVPLRLEIGIDTADATGSGPRDAFFDFRAGAPARAGAE